MSIMGFRPPWANVTAIRAQSGMVHMQTGWNAFEGVRVACGRRLRYGDDDANLSAFNVTKIQEAWETTPIIPCPKCLAIARARELG